MSSEYRRIRKFHVMVEDKGGEGKEMYTWKSVLSSRLKFVV